MIAEAPSAELVPLPCPKCEGGGKVETHNVYWNEYSTNCVACFDAEYSGDPLEITSSSLTGQGTGQQASIAAWNEIVEDYIDRHADDCTACKGKGRLWGGWGAGYQTCATCNGSRTKAAA